MGHGLDNSGPSEIEGHGEFPADDAIWNTCTKYRIELKYPENITMIIAGGHDDIKSGTKWIGTDGWVWVDRGGFRRLQSEWEEIRNFPRPAQGETLQIQQPSAQLPRLRQVAPAHDCPVETAHHSAIPGHLGLISMLVGRKIRWDVKSEKIIGDPEAAKLLTRAYRPPWKLGLI